jgi:hypothetical protein
MSNCNFVPQISNVAHYQFSCTDFNFPVIFSGMDFAGSRRKSNFTGKITVAAALTVMCIIVLKQSPGFSSSSVVCHCHLLLTGPFTLFF